MIEIKYCRMRNNECAPPVGCEENNQQGNQQTDVGVSNNKKEET